MADSQLAIGRSRDPRDVDGFVVAAYDAHHVALFDLLARATLEPSAAEELLEEAFTRLAAEVRAGRPPSPVAGWLQRVACQLVVEHASRPVSGRRRGAVMAREPEPRTELDDVLAGLSPEARLALLLSAQGVRGDDLALALGRTSEATRTLLSVARARVRLRRELAHEGGS